VSIADAGQTALQLDLGMSASSFTSEVTAHYVDDPVLFGAQRIMFPI